MKGSSTTKAGTRSARATGAGTNQDVVVTLAAISTEQHVLDWIHCSADVSGAVQVALTITAGGETIFKTFVRPATTTEVFMPITFGNGLQCGFNKEVVITLGAMTSSIGEVNVGYR